MATDPFDGIKTLTQEIGQPTFVELIYTQRKTGQFRRQGITVDASFPQLAFKRPYSQNSHDPIQNKLSALPQHTHSLSATTQNVSSQNVSNSLNNILRNSVTDCATSNILHSGCNLSNCAIDVVFVVDTSASMKTTIQDLKTDILNITGQLTAISNNYRMGLVEFYESSTVDVMLDSCMSSTNIDNFVYAISSIDASGVAINTNSTAALEKTINGEIGFWRADATKIVILLTNTLPGNADGVYDQETKTQSEELAIEAGSCGINIIAINCNTVVDNDLRLLMANYASRSNGIYLENKSGTNNSAYIHQFIRKSCSEQLLSYQNKITNGSFDSDLAGWSITGSAFWATEDSNGFMVLSEGTATKTISNLTPGNRVKLTLIVAGIAGSGLVGVAINDSEGDQPLNGGLNIFNGTTIERSAIVPQSGNIVVAITNKTSPSTMPVYIDNVVLYEITEYPCGFGAINLITNSTFADGVNGWVDGNDEQLPDYSQPVYSQLLLENGGKLLLENGSVLVTEDEPVESGDFFDPTNYALIINPLARYLIPNLAIGQNLILNFELLDNQPDSNDNLEFTWTAKDSDDNIIATDTLVRSEVSYPHQIAASLTIPIGFVSPLVIEFTSDGVATVKDVYCCYQAGIHSETMTKLSLDRFVNRGGWAGGTMNSGGVIVNQDTNILQQTYFELSSQSILRLSVTCRTVGGIIVELFYTNSTVIEQFFSDGEVGIKSFVSSIPPGTSMVTVRVRSMSTTTLVDDILVCQEEPASCDMVLTNLRACVIWNGVPRSPTNIFNLIARVTYRDPNNHLQLSTVNLLTTGDGRLGFLTPTECGEYATYDFWKQMGDAGITQSNITNFGLTTAIAKTITADSIVDVTSRQNWLWSIPVNNNGTDQDGLVSLLEQPPIGIIQSIEILFLANNISGRANSTACTPLFENVTDPADSLDIVIRYENRGRAKEHRKTINRAALYNIVANSITSWDTISSVGYGIKGTKARWESTTFDIDTVDGTGLDQCTEPLFFNTVGSGTLMLSNPTTSGYGLVVVKCASDVIISEVTKGVSIDEVQSITLPNRSGGRWTLTFNYRGFSNSIEVPWNATASQLQALMVGMPLVRSVDDIVVTGSGDENDPFVITFTRTLGGRNIPKLEVDTANLTGTGSAIVTRLVDGTNDEQQTITKLKTATSLALSFADVGPTSIPLPASANGVRLALESLSSVGAGNITVSCDGVENSTPNFGPWRVRFIGVFASQNVPQLVPTDPTRFSVSTNWQGGVGTNEIQQLVVSATDGTFVLTIQNPNPTGGFVITAPIIWNASAVVITAAITDVAPWLIGNLKITKLSHDQNNPGQIKWTIEYKNAYAGTPMDLMEATAAGLINATYKTRELVSGGGTSERQRVQVVDSDSGNYTLVLTIYETSYQTDPIDWDATVETIAETIQELPPFVNLNDIRVVDCEPSLPNASSCFTVIFHPRFGDVDLMLLTNNNLQCNPLGIQSVQSPPYQYELQECATPSVFAEFNSLCCNQSTLCKPGEGGVDVEDELCCDADNLAVNTYSELILQRELFDPNHQKTSCNRTETGPLIIKDLAVLRGLKPSLFNAYTRNYVTGVLTPTDFSTPVETKMSVVLVLKNEDTIATRRRISNQLIAKNILPSRMVWESLVS